MSTSISSAGPNAATLTQLTLGSPALMQSVPGTETSPAQATVSVVDPSATAARVAKYLDALDAPLKMGNDARNVANALTSTMQSVVSERPDLADAHFDFHSSNGSVQITSQDMSASDISWLQGKLNGNTSLVASVKAFHDDAVSGYAEWAEADGTPLTQSQSDAVSKKADGLGGFMSLFQSLGQDAQKYQMQDGNYELADGSTMNLGQDPTSAAGFLLFSKSAQAAENGTSSFVSTSGKTLYGGRMDIFQNTSVIPGFFPDSGTTSLGFSQTA
ncbi:hypothetical protein BJG93_29825 (plasmid) [Paraburkholderia sprentiae WSM5005]|uniref:Uncharacterized protein n=1 Tax=Paraburkholderia sprentiae WSM5005 TaxID=754502 RepID=A0A1I9YU08_9BURK|nr:hypothetical protein [Paraburkholderia sprentiae]APA89679.1 hypothetical protein BJG93_29825 [Paraburkholderia sprentiae WSM5005]